MSRLRLRGLRAGNLRGVDLELPQGRWTALHGPSGAGKSAVLFGVLEPVARRRFRVLRDPAALPGGDESWLERLAGTVEGLQPAVAWAGEVPRGRRGVEVGAALDLWRPLARAFRERGGRRCGACEHEWRAPGLDALLARAEALPEDAPLHVWSAAGGADAEELLRGGWTRARIGGELVRLEELDAALPADAWLLLDRFRWSEARAPRLEEALTAALRRGTALRWEAGAVAEEQPPAEVCPACGARVPQREDGAVAALEEAEDLVLAGRSWTAWRRAPFSEWLRGAEVLPEELVRRLRFLDRTGLGHLHGVRTLGTLSLGESRRLELAALSSLVRRDQLLLFDEPGMGLHGRERGMLVGLLRELVEQGNTVLTADPSREFLEGADEWVLLGPGGGPAGGTVVGRGPRAALPPYEEDLPPPRALPGSGALGFRGLRTRFLAIDELELPLGNLTGICGVSGSGKSTLLEEELVPRLRAGEGFRGELPAGGVAVLLERALGSAAMSTVATLSGAWGEVRRAFADGEEGRIRGLAPADLVARPGQGACAACRGHGQDEDHLPCAGCDGLGLREDLLELRLRGRSLRHWLSTPLAALEKRLPAGSKLRRLLSILDRLGLGERRLGERGRHLSLGERSRVALARELAAARRDRPKLFLLDEPCLGLPAGEARKVVEVLRDLTTEGHGFWVVEHHEILLRSADHLVEIGPGSGPEGGQLLHSGLADALLGADTPTGRWLSGRRESLAPPPEAAVTPPAAAGALPESWAREGRARLEADLRRELATRSPLLADAVCLDAGAGGLLPPTAWPVAAPAGAALLEVLGLSGRLDEAMRHAGAPACRACGGAGPYAELTAALEDGPRGLPPGEHRFLAPLRLGAGARGSEADLLRAAGFRRVLRGGELVSLTAGVELLADDEVLLDRLDPRAEDDGPQRLRELEHHARLLGGGEVRARAEGVREWTYRAGACRDCGAGDAASPAELVHQLAGRSRAELLAEPLATLLEHLTEHAPAPAPFRRARRLLAGSSLLRRSGGQRVGGLQPLEARLARTAGWCLFPVEGVVLLHDQPLAGLPPALARKLAEALDQRGLHLWTDAEGYSLADAAPVQTAPFRPQPFSLEFDLADWADPPPAAPEATLRRALGLVEPLRRHFLATEEARLRGWAGADLGAGREARRCPACLGHGGGRPHPELLLACPRCGGSGWAAECAALEDRGLSWNRLGRCRIDELAEHFADSPRLAGPLRRAVELGLGGQLLDEELRRLPLGAATLAPLAAELAAGTPLEACSLAHPLAGLSPLEASEFLSTMGGYLSGSRVPEWKEHHPALQLPA